MARKTAKRETGQAPERLAALLQRIAANAAKVDDMAGEILALLKRHKVVTLERFERVTDAAYEANGWQKGAGRPRAGDERTAVPDAVKVYMSQIRKAYKAGIHVTNYTSMYELRTAVSDTSKPPSRRRGKRQKAGGKDVPELVGVYITDPAEFNGALFHDVIVAWRALKGDDREAFEKRIERVIRDFSKKHEDTIPEVAKGVEVPAAATLQ